MRVFLASHGHRCTTTLLGGCFEFLEAIKQALTKLFPNSLFREGCHVSEDPLQALLPSSSSSLTGLKRSDSFKPSIKQSSLPHSTSSTPQPFSPVASCLFFFFCHFVFYVKSELSPCFPQSLVLIFLLFSSANLFKLLSPFLLSPSLISKPLSLCAAGAQLCVCDCVCVHTCVCVCVVVWVFSGTVLPHRT